MIFSQWGGRKVEKTTATLCALILVIAGLLTASQAQENSPADCDCPKPEIEDPRQALHDPDHYAWRLFVELNHPAEVSTKCPDTAKPFGSDGTVLWEAWRNVRFGSEDAVFRALGADPGPWRSHAAPRIRSDEDMSRISPKQVEGMTPQEIFRQLATGELADPAVGNFNETRMNRDAYLFIRANKLYDKREQMRKAAEGTLNLAFPVGAKEVKAQWRRIREQDKSRYHWAEFQTNSGKQLWGLTALHIITKDTPNWFWATFEHVDNGVAGLRPGGFGDVNEGWEFPSVDRFACPNSPSTCAVSPSAVGETRIQGTKWEHYRLRGTQIDFVDTIGRPTRLANSQMEVGQPDSSCMTCHALASVDREGHGLGFEFTKGVPETSRFVDPATEKPNRMQFDFVFSLSRAQPSPP